MFETLDESGVNVVLLCAMKTTTLREAAAMTAGRRTDPALLLDPGPDF